MTGDFTAPRSLVVMYRTGWVPSLFEQTEIYRIFGYATKPAPSKVRKYFTDSVIVRPTENDEVRETLIEISECSIFELLRRPIWGHEKARAKRIRRTLRKRITERKAA